MKEIPAFTVLKNNSILKNIFLLHKQQLSSNQDSDELILLVGRHPNCNITLEHPSISRYHLRIHSNPSTRSLSVFDLSSVHGTWVSGKRIEPGVHVELKEGDTVKMGGSSRVYELHWVPVSRAYDDDGQFMSTIYTIKEGEEEMNQDEKLEFMSDDELERSELSFSNMIHHNLPVKKLDLLTCLTSSCDDSEVECSSPSKAGNGAISVIDDSDGPNTSENQSNWSCDNMSTELKMLNRDTDKDTVLIQPTLAVSETVSAIQDSVSLNKSEDELNWFMDNLINEFELQNDGIIEEIPFSVPNCSLSESEDDMSWLRDNLSNEFELKNHGIINNDPFSVPNCSKSLCHDSPVKILNLLTSSDPDFFTSSCDDTEVECSSPSKTGNVIISGIEDSDGLNTSESQSNLSSDNMSKELKMANMSEELKMANHETHKDGPLSVPNCSKSSFDDTALFQPPLVVSETISAIQDSVSLKFSEDELNWLMDNLSNGSEMQNDGSIKEDPFSVLNFPLSESEDVLDWLRDNLSNEFDLENHGIINKDPFSVLNCSKSFCDVTELEHLSPWNRHTENIMVGFLETISAIEDSASLNNSTDRLNRLEDISSDDFKLIHDVFSVRRCSKSSCLEHLRPPKTECENGQIFATHSSQSPLISETEISNNLIKSEDQMNGLNDNFTSEFEFQNQEIIKEDPFSVPNCSKIACDNTEVKYSSSWKTEISDCLNKSEVELNWLRDNLSNVSEQLVYGTMKDGLVSVACFDVTKPHEKDAASQDIERHNEIVMRYENEPVNQQTINYVSVPVALSDNVSRDEDESFMPDTAESKEANVDSEVEHMNQIKMADDSAVTVVLIDGADIGNKIESIDHEIMKKESVFMALPDGTDLDLEQSFTPDISRAKEVHPNRVVMKNVSVSMNLFSTLDGNELEIFTPDKENKNPNAFSVKSLNKGPMEDVSSPIVNKENNNISFSKQLLTSVDESYSAFLQRSLNDVAKVDQFVYCEEPLFSSSEKETKSRQLEMEGSCYPQTIQKVIDSSHNIQGEAKKRWTMVVDASSLLCVESLKCLKLMEGLKGTQIVVPKIVKRELMDIQSQDNILKRNTEKVSLALKWIDECMANTRWWILMDDEILLSSELESEVLETALHLSKEITDRKIIILSNDLTLKTKAMAEGIMCEAAEEFHTSLVNPFSERFMWVGSLARGLTWSSINDDILRQKYHGCGLHGSRGLKGLKLLAHDTNFHLEV